MTVLTHLNVLQEKDLIEKEHINEDMHHRQRLSYTKRPGEVGMWLYFLESVMTMVECTLAF